MLVQFSNIRLVLGKIGEVHFYAFLSLPLSQARLNF